MCGYIKIMNPKSYTNCLYGNPSVGTSELNVWLCNILKYRFICLSSVLTNTKFYHDKKLLEDFQALLLPWGLVFLLKKKKQIHSFSHCQVFPALKKKSIWGQFVCNCWVEPAARVHLLWKQYCVQYWQNLRDLMCLS